MLLIPADSNAISDALNAPAVQHHLTNWGFWSWLGMILLVIVLGVVAILVAAAIPEHFSSGAALAGNVMFGFYAAALYPLMRHFPWPTLVVVLAIVLSIVMCCALVSLEAGSVVSYLAAIVGNVAPALLDTIIARHLASIPMSWSMLGLLLLLGALIGIAGLFRR